MADKVLGLKKETKTKKTVCISRWNYDNDDDSQSIWNYYPLTIHTLRDFSTSLNNVLDSCTYTDLELVSSVTFSSFAKNCLSKGTSGWPDSVKTKRAEFGSCFWMKTDSERQNNKNIICTIPSSSELLQSNDFCI